MVQYNSIAMLPPHLDNCSLETLNIEGTAIEELPPDIGEFGELQDLIINHTPIKAIPESIGRIRTLKTLNLAMTKIPSLPSTITDCHSLS